MAKADPLMKMVDDAELKKSVSEIKKILSAANYRLIDFCRPLWSAFFWLVIALKYLVSSVVLMSICFYRITKYGIGVSMIARSASCTLFVFYVLVSSSPAFQ